MANDEPVLRTSAGEIKANMTDEMDDTAKRALAEAQAQLKVVQILSGCKPESRGRIMEALILLLKADEIVPGILARFH